MDTDLDDKIFLFKEQNHNIIGYKAFQGKIADFTEDVYCSKELSCYFFQNNDLGMEHQFRTTWYRVDYRK